jgi:hypothetical protein
MVSFNISLGKVLGRSLTDFCTVCVPCCAVCCRVQAIKEISENPSNEVMGRWLDHPKIGPLVATMWKAMQMQRQQQQQRQGL